MDIYRTEGHKSSSAERFLIYENRIRLATYNICMLTEKTTKQIHTMINRKINNLGDKSIENENMED